MYDGKKSLFPKRSFLWCFFFADLGLINGLVHPLNFHHLSWEDARRWEKLQKASGPFQFLETPRVECSLWPTLYWCTEMCETVERATDTVDALPGFGKECREEKSDGTAAQGEKYLRG